MNQQNYAKSAGRYRRAAIILLAFGTLMVNQAQAQWQTLGAATGISTANASFQNLRKDATGNYYVSFYDLSVSKGSVMKYDGNSWSYLGGTAGITTGTATYSSLAVTAAGDVYYCNQDGYPASGINVRKFSNGTWTSLPNAESATSNFQALSLDNNDIPVIAYSANSRANVKKYNGTSWDILGTGLPSGVPYYIDIVVGSNDSAYVSYVNGSNFAVYKIHSNAASGDNWTQLGSGFSATSSEQFRSAMAIDALNNVYVAYTSLSARGNKINVSKYSNGQWTAVGAADFSTGRVHYVDIAVNHLGIPYIAFSEFGNAPDNKNSVMKFNGTDWETVGDFLSNGGAKWNSLSFDNIGNPVVAYSDDNVSGGGNMVKRFVPAGCTNTMPAGTAGSLGCVTFSYKGQTVIYTTVRAADGNVWLQHNLGTNAVAAAKDDANGYGDYFQWGRWDDGHQSPTSATTAAPVINNPSGLAAGNPGFITGSSSGAWWYGGQLTDTWDGDNAAAASATQGVDPCKAIGNGWRLPVQSEWATVVTEEQITSPDLAFSSNLKLTVAGSRSSSTGNYDFVSARGYYWSSTTSTTGGKYYYYSAAVNNPNAGNLRGGGAAVRCLYSIDNIYRVDSVRVGTLNNTSPDITTNGGTLQITAAVYPATANQNVTWSVINVNGNASISPGGLLTAIGNGTIWAKAVSVQDVTKSDSILITIANQVMPITALNVNTTNNVPAIINTNAGTLQMQATILPANANQNVTWSLVPVNGNAVISNTGLVTAITDGTVWAKAVSVQDASKTDSLLITISGQVVPVTALEVSTNGTSAAITSSGGTLQVIATVLPSTANQNVTWSIINGTGTATISNTGLVTALTNGTVWAKAVSVQDASKMDSLQISISNQNTTHIDKIGGTASIEVYPNPAQQSLFVNISGTEALQAVIINITGQQQKQILLKQGINTVDISPLAKGIYYIYINDNKQKQVFTFIKE